MRTDQFPALRTTSAAERLRLLQDVPIFQGLSTEQLVPLAEAASVVRFDAGDTIVYQGGPGDCMYVIVSGHVKVGRQVRHANLTTEAIVSYLVAGDVLGELALLDGQPRSASCVAVTPTTCLCLDRDTFRNALQAHWPLNDALLRVCAQRLRAADALIAQQARDPVTGLYNRQAFHEFYRHEISRTRRAARQPGGSILRPPAALFADIDRFKEINDRHGHQTGDKVLRAAAQLLTTASREIDVVARHGGDEFVVLLPDAGEEGAAAVVDRIEHALRERPPGPVDFHLSIGTAVVNPEQPQPLELLLEQADLAMYRAKARNRATANRQGHPN